MKVASNVLDYEDTKNHNMYGCAPCPKCGSKFRASYKRLVDGSKDGLRIECDDCGHKEWAVELPTDRQVKP